MKIPFVMQIKNADNGAAALATMLGYYGRYVSLRQMRDVCYTSRNGSSPEQILQAAEHFGLKAELKTTSFEELKRLKLPVMVCWKKKYYTVVTKITKKMFRLLTRQRVTFRFLSKSLYMHIPDALLVYVQQIISKKVE